MTDDLDSLRRLRPDGVLSDEPPDVDVLAAGRHRLLAETIGAASAAPMPTPTIYPRLAYRDERAGLEFQRRAPGCCTPPIPRTCSGATAATRPSTWRDTAGTSPSVEEAPFGTRGRTTTHRFGRPSLVCAGESSTSSKPRTSRQRAPAGDRPVQRAR